MSLIDACLKSILTAVYGRDVRQAIHDGIKQCYDDISTGKTLADNATASANSAAENANRVAEQTTKTTQANTERINEAIRKSDGAVASNNQKVNAAVSSAEGAASRADSATAATNAATANANNAAGNANTQAKKASDAADAITGLKAEANTVAPTQKAGANFNAASKTFSFDIPQGVKGDTGVTPKITMTAKTGEPGTDVQINQNGTPEAPNIEVTIPRGNPGKGAVSTVNGQMPDSNGNIELTAAQVKARPDTWTPTAEETGALPADGTAKNANKLDSKAIQEVKSGHDVLHNSYFLKPINQHGVASGEYWDGYGIDRWKSFQPNRVKWIDGQGIVFDTLGGNQLIDQLIDPDYFEKITGKTYTASAMINGVVYWVTGTVPFLKSVPGVASFWMIDNLFRLWVDDGVTATITAARCEPGDIQTLGHEEDGAWVLNDPPPDEALELAKCKRYFVPSQSDWTSGAVIPGAGIYQSLPCVMRASPSRERIQATAPSVFIGAEWHPLTIMNVMSKPTGVDIVYRKDYDISGVVLLDKTPELNADL